jgi:flotillin
MSVLVAAGATIAAFMLLLTFISEFLYICEPNEVLVLSGGRWSAETGGRKGYRICFGGRAWRIPFIERVDRVDMRIMPIEIRVSNAYSEGGIPLDIRAIANVKISSDPEVIGNAVERFLGMPHSAIERVAKETLEGNLRGVLATMTPEEINEDRIKFSELIQNEVHRDLAKLGLDVDTLKIQNIHDSVDYMDSISRVEISRVQAEAVVAESDAKQQAEKAESETQASIKVAQQKAETAIKQKQNELAALESELAGQVNAEVERTEAAGREARAQAERRLQEIRTQLEQLRLTAEVVLPAEASQDAERLRAAGSAAIISERGRATADAFKALSDAWAEAGNDARDVFILQKLDDILQRVVKSVERVRTGSVTLVDSGGGETLPAYVASFPAIVGSVLAQIRDTLGVDLLGALRPRPGAPPAPPPPPPPAVDLASDIDAETVFGLVVREMARDGRLAEARKATLPELALMLSLAPEVQEKTIQAAEADASAGKIPPGPAVTPENVYAKAYYLAIKDHHLSARERKHLDSLAQALKLGNDTRVRVEAAVHGRSAGPGKPR